MFLDAAIMLQGQPRDDLLATWVGLLQRPRMPGRNAPVSLNTLQLKAAGMLTALENSSLLTSMPA
jgi:hypothetical protein